MTNAQNRQRWTQEQKKQAQAAFAVTVKPVGVERAERLVSLRALADTLSTAPWASETLDAVRGEIKRLEITAPRPVYCPYRGGLKQVCETPNACAGGADCRRGVDPSASQMTA